MTKLKGGCLDCGAPVTRGTKKTPRSGYCRKCIAKPIAHCTKCNAFAVTRLCKNDRGECRECSKVHGNTVRKSRAVQGVMKLGAKGASGVTQPKNMAKAKPCRAFDECGNYVSNHYGTSGYCRSCSLKKRYREAWAWVYDGQYLSVVESTADYYAGGRNGGQWGTRQVIEVSVIKCPKCGGPGKSVWSEGDKFVCWNDGCDWYGSLPSDLRSGNTSGEALVVHTNRSSCCPEGGRSEPVVRRGRLLDQDSGHGGALSNAQRQGSDHDPSELAGAIAC